MVHRKKAPSLSKPKVDKGPQKQDRKRKKRVRGQKAKAVSVLGAGELPDVRQLKGGKKRLLDVYKKEDEAALPRKTREMLAMMEHLDGGKGAKQGKASNAKSGNQTLNSKAEVRAIKNDKTAASSPWAEENKPGKAKEPRQRMTAKERMTEGMREGESFKEYSHRLRVEAKKMITMTRRKDTRKAEKRKAFYKRKDERKERKRRRRLGLASDSDEDPASRVSDGEDDEMTEGERKLSELPMYWQEIVHNGGRPISEKKRRRLARLEKAAEDRIEFGEQAERPPEFDSLPKRRGQRGD